MMKSMRKLMILLTAMLIGFGSFVISTAHVYAGGESLEYDKTNVLDDLRSSTAGGSAFDINDYPFDSTGLVQKPGVIGFIEYCYSFRENKRANFGLYLYVYNPQALNFDTASRSNKVQLAVAYDADGIPNDYEKFDLVFCNKAEESNYKNLFYKFRIKDHKSADGKYIADRVNSNERRYDLVGIELVTYGATNAVDYGIGGTFRFTGYAGGYGPDPDAESSLKCAVTELESVELELKNTFYRTKTSSKGAGYQNQLDTVYFAVPKRLFDSYGSLQRIKAEWYEYKTNDIIVTSNNAFYNAALPFMGVQLGAAYNSSIGYSLGQGATVAGGFGAAYWGWNLGTGYLHPPCDILNYLFLVENISGYDPYADIEEIGGVTSNVLYNYIKRYDKSYIRGTLPIKDNSISADLFTADIDAYRKVDSKFGKVQQGYSYYDFDADVDLQKLSSWNEGNPSFWDNASAWGFWNAIIGNVPNEVSRTVAPLYFLKSSDLSGTEAQVSENLLVHSSSVPALRDFYNEAAKDKQDEKVVVLFRFATTDYYSAPIDIIELDKGFLGTDKHTSGQAYRAWESVFFDFDVIQLTFSKNGVYRVIPVVASPIDIIGPITPPFLPDSSDWWMIILMLLALLLVIIFIIAILPQLLTFVFGFAGGVAKIPGKVIKSTKRRRRRRR